MTATVVADLGYGDAGKGSVVDYLTRQHRAGVVVRYNGGAQAAHNVVTPDGRHHRFSQFGSGSFVPGVKTHLSRFMLINPLYLMQEAARLTEVGVQDVMARLTIDEYAPIITPYHQAANQIRELMRGPERHGSCGHGVGETVSDGLLHPADQIVAGDLSSRTATFRKLTAIRNRILDEFSTAPDLPAVRTLRDSQLIPYVVDFYMHFAQSARIVYGDYLGRLLETNEHAIFEGAQGVLLDEWRGFHPYTTWSTTTFANADTLLAEAGYEEDVVHLGLLRAYATRHGVGPFVTEDRKMEITEAHNTTNDWQAAFRTGWFDAVASRYAIEVAGRVDALAITCLDLLPKLPLVATRYHTGAARLTSIKPGTHKDLFYQQGLTDLLWNCTPHYEIVKENYVDYLESTLRTPVTITSHGPTALDKRSRVGSTAWSPMMSKTHSQYTA